MTIPEVNLSSKAVSDLIHPSSTSKTRPKSTSKHSHSVESEAKRRAKLIIESDTEADFVRVEQLRHENHEGQPKQNVFISRGRSEFIGGLKEEERLLELDRAHKFELACWRRNRWQENAEKNRR